MASFLLGSLLLSYNFKAFTDFNWDTITTEPTGKINPRSNHHKEQLKKVDNKESGFLCST